MAQVVKKCGYASRYKTCKRYVTLTKVLQNSTPKETIWTRISTRMITQLDSQFGETLIARALPLNMYNYQKQGGQRGYKGQCTIINISQDV